MPRTIPISLQSHLDGETTTTCHILRIEPVRSGYSVIGLTDLDRDVIYDDGDGEVTYLAPVGFVASTVVATADFAVDNAETRSLFPEYDIPQISEADINAGAYDYAKFRLSLVNYEDLTMGAVRIMTGTLGEMKTVDGLSFIGELRSLFQQFRQSIVERDSLSCRATFGSQPLESSSSSSSSEPTGVKRERFPCGIDAEALWVDGTVGTVGVEPDIAFRDDGLPSSSSNEFAPGLVEWLTGNNAGRQYEVEAYADGIVVLSFPTNFTIEVGDTFRIRPDCTKAWGGPMSCETYNNRLNFRGEPFIPVGDSGSTAVPGAADNGGLTGIAAFLFQSEQSQEFLQQARSANVAAIIAQRYGL